MGEYFRNAMEYFGKPNLTPENDFVGKIVEIHVTGTNPRMRLKVRNLIAEGSTAYIYKVEDAQTGKEYALKRFFGIEREDCITIRKELNFQKILPFHENIVKFIGTSEVEGRPSPLGPRNLSEFYLVTELCKGTLYDYINYKQSQSEIPALEVIARCFMQCVKSVEFLHKQRVPITHRDIKIENFLIGKDLRLKLCDFGSATTDFHMPTIEWNARQRETLQEHLMKVTTPIYRSPEIIDIWSNYPIGPAVDVWSLGCILYFLCFQKHPFENNSILYITNGKYSIPKDNPALVSHSQCFHDIIKECLQVNPDKRMDISYLSINFEQIAVKECGINDLESGIEDLRVVIPKEDVLSVISENYSNNIHASTSSISGFMSQVKGGAENIFKNIKQNINRHQQHLQQTHFITNNNQTPLFLTSKIVIIIFPSSSTGTPFFKHFQQNDMDPIRLENLSFYNLNKDNKLIALPPPIRVVEAGSIYNLANEKCPTLECLQILVDDIFAFLTTDNKNVVVLQNDDVKLMGTVLTALLMFSGLIEKVDDALQICALKLNLDLNLRTSQLRYLYYLPRLPVPRVSVYLEIIMCKFVRSQKNKFHRLFLEIFGKSDQIILSTEADISPNGELAKFPVAMSLGEEITMIFYHSNGGSKSKVGQLQFNTAFEMKSKSKTSNIFFSCKDLDDTKTDFLFDVKMSLTINNSEDDNTARQTNSYNNKPFLNRRNPDILFSSQAELNNMMKIFGPKRTQVPDENFGLAGDKDVILDCNKKSEELFKEVGPFETLVDLSEERLNESSNALYCDNTIDSHIELDDIFTLNPNEITSFPTKKPGKYEHSSHLD